MDTTENKKSTLSGDKKFLLPINCMKLIITEKPSVARQFANAIPENFTRNDGFLQSDNYYITWCIGHLITMSYPEKYDENMKTWSLDTIPFIPKEYLYEEIAQVKDQYKIVNKLLNSKDLDTIYYAGDSGREGEYIQRLVRNYGGYNKNAAEKRIWIDSQTDEEILKGIREAKDLSYYNTVSDAGYLRAQEDYLFGINLSRALTLKYARLYNKAVGASKYKPIAVGRVMTYVLGMIVERERLIRTTKEIPFYGVKGIFGADAVTADWDSKQPSQYFESPLLLKSGAFLEKANADSLCSSLSSIGSSLLYKKTLSDETKNAPLLFNLTELQSACSSKFKISPSETLDIAQKLYEAKLTTYPRTDAKVLSTAIAKVIDANISSLKKINGYSDIIDSILNSGSYKKIADTKYTDDSKITDHYAIIPTESFNSNEFEKLTPIERNVYLLIVNRFLSIFMPSARYKRISCEFRTGNEPLFCTKKKCIDYGFLKLYGNTSEDEESDDAKTYTYLESLNENITYPFTFEVTTGKTSPPKRFTSGSAVLAMENAGNLVEEEELREMIKTNGIGTPATRAEIISKLEKNGYIALNKKTQVLTPTVDGEVIYNIIKLTVPSLLSANMTASWEKGLNAVQNGSIKREEYTEKINNYIITEVNKIKAENRNADVNASLKEIKSFYPKICSTEEVTLVCPLCGGSVNLMNWGAGCSNYKTQSCNFSVSRTIAGKILDDNQLMDIIKTGISGLIKGFKSKAGKEFSAKIKYNKIEHKTEFVFENISSTFS